MLIQGPNNPGNFAHVDDRGRLEVHAVGASEQSSSSNNGEAFNLNTKNITLTNATATPVFYLKNVGEERALIIPKIFFTTTTSVGGTGSVAAWIISNPTGGTIISTDTLFNIYNFNFGSGNEIATEQRKGVTGSTVTGGEERISFLFPLSGRRDQIDFESIVLPRGSSMVFVVQPPTGNTSMTLQAGTNVYLNLHD